jgi:hypothetical protein
MLRPSRLLALASALVLLSCRDSALPSAPEIEPGFDISDAVHTGGNPHFFWLPPLVDQPSAFNGDFDATQMPVVRICDLADCAGLVITEYSMTTGPGSGTVRVSVIDEHYIVNWHIGDFAVSPGPTYRIIASVGGTELGYSPRPSTP